MIAQVNFCTLSGVITKDIAIKEVISSGRQYLSFDLANQRNYKENNVYKANYITVQVWIDGLMQKVLDECEKGTRVTVTGELKIDRFKDDSTGKWNCFVALRATFVQPWIIKKDAIGDLEDDTDVAQLNGW